MTRPPQQDNKSEPTSTSSSPSQERKGAAQEPSQMVSGALKIFNNLDRQASQSDKNFLRLLSALISVGVKEVSRLEAIVEEEKQQSPLAIVVPIKPKPSSPDEE